MVRYRSLLLCFPEYRSNADLEDTSLWNLIAAHPSAVAWLVSTRVLPSGLDNHFRGVLNDFTEEFEGGGLPLDNTECTNA